MEIHLRTLTPLWTGGVEGNCDRIHETGIIGSLRWWYEAIVRGLGGWACDPTSRGGEADDEKTGKACQFDAKAYQQALNDDRPLNEALNEGLKTVCPVCYLFGCTGWRRRFRLVADANMTKPEYKFCLATLDDPGKFNNWWLGGVFEKAIGTSLFFGDVTLDFGFFSDYERYSNLIYAVLSVMSRYGAIGARAQYGFGQFEIENAITDQDAFALIRNVISEREWRGGDTHKDWYSLSLFWHFSCEVPDRDMKDQKKASQSLINQFKEDAKVVGDPNTFQRTKNLLLPVSFDIRYKLPGAGNSERGLRQAHRRSHSKAATREVYGTAQGDRSGSRVFVSHLYKEDPQDPYFRLRVWGFTEQSVGDEARAELKRLFPNATIETTRGKELIEARGDGQ